MRLADVCKSNWGVMVVALFAWAPLAFAQGALPAQSSQAAVARPLSFEVVSIRRDTSGSPPSIQSPQNGDTVTMRDMVPRMLIGFAFDLPRHDDLYGLPPWADTEAYDITAKVAESDLAAFHALLPRQRNPMLRPLLVNRFHLKYHYESKPLSAYRLVVAKGGAKLTPVPPAVTAEGHPGAGGIRSGPNAITTTGAAIAVLVDALSQQLGRPVLDGTGLTGRYSYALRFAPVQPSSEAGEAEPDAPSLFTALQDQLGLKLESIKAPVRVLVVDQIERPSEN